VFSTFLYTGNGSTQTITNGIDLSGSGGLVWTKNRVGAEWHCLADTTRGLGNNVFTNSTDPNQFQATGITSASSTGYTIGNWSGINTSSQAHVSWTFREAPKFFDVVTWTGNGVDGRQIAHNLGVTPGCIMYKCTSTAAVWIVLHRGLPNGFSDAIILNSTDASFILGSSFAPTATTFTMGSTVEWNQSGQTYVAYLYAHDTASDGIIQCGSYTGNGSATGPTVTLGWEPQWLMVKRASGGTSNWQIIDNMRGFPVGSADATLWPNSANAETSAEYVSPNATGFQVVSSNSQVNTSGNTYIYMAIRRGPMKTPTLGTSVFLPITSSGTAGTQLTTNFPVDLAITARRPGTDEYKSNFTDRLRRMQATDEFTGQKILVSSSTGAETEDNSAVAYQFWNTGFLIGNQNSGSSTAYWNFRRAPGFFDTVCYTGTGATRTVAHNLGVAPELIITKSRSSGFIGWPVWFGNLSNYVYLNSTAGSADEGINPSPTTSAYSLTSGNSSLNGSGTTYVAYLFASAPGVSKVGSYTGTGALQTINCAFTSGARFVLIKRTDSTGDWFVWDSARGITSGNDPYLLLNSTAAEVTGTNYVDTDTTGFKVTAAAPAGINASGGNYIFLAIS
jgi:hypothetical protein